LYRRGQNCDIISGRGWGHTCRQTNKQHTLPQEIEINQRGIATIQGLAAIQIHKYTGRQFNCLSRWQIKTTTENTSAREPTLIKKRAKENTHHSVESKRESETLIEVSIRK